MTAPAARRRGPLAYAVKLWQLVTFIGFFLWELVVASLRVGYDIVTPDHHMRPGIVGVPLDARTDLEITLLANLITLTPGTLSLDVSDDRQTLYIHVAYLTDRDELEREIKQRFERRLLELLRWS